MSSSCPNKHTIQEFVVFIDLGFVSLWFFTDKKPWDFSPIWLEYLVVGRSFWILILGLQHFFRQKNHDQTYAQKKPTKRGRKFVNGFTTKVWCIKTHHKGMGLVFLLRGNAFPDVFFATNKGKKSCYSKKNSAVFFGGGEILHNKKGGYNKPWNFWDPYKKQPGFVFGTSAFGSPGACWHRWSGPGVGDVSIVLQSASSRSEVNSQAKPGIWPRVSAVFIRSFRCLGGNDLSGGFRNRSMMKKYHFYYFYMQYEKMCVYCFLK